MLPWTRGVDNSLFHPKAEARDVTGFNALKGPIQLYVGRVAIEKNIEAFLDSQVPGTKVVVGDGPALTELKERYPHAHFLGPKFGEDLANYYSAADVFVFPSKTDTFGLVMIEALACGTPVAAYPVQGPLDVVGADGMGPFEAWTKTVAALDNSLETAIEGALALSSEDCANFARLYSWKEVTCQFVDALTLIHAPHPKLLKQAAL